MLRKKQYTSLGYFPMWVKKIKYVSKRTKFHFVFNEMKGEQKFIYANYSFAISLKFIHTSITISCSVFLSAKFFNKKPNI